MTRKCSPQCFLLLALTSHHYLTSKKRKEKKTPQVIEKNSLVFTHYVNILQKVLTLYTLP